MKPPRIGRVVIRDEALLHRFFRLMCLMAASGLLVILAGSLLLAWVPGVTWLAVIALFVGGCNVVLGVRNALRARAALRGPVAPPSQASGS